jgi:hypothetical protein
MIKIDRRKIKKPVNHKTYELLVLDESHFVGVAGLLAPNVACDPE